MGIELVRVTRLAGGESPPPPAAAAARQRRGGGTAGGAPPPPSLPPPLEIAPTESWLYGGRNRIAFKDVADWALLPSGQ
jgi:hypothetical protein